MMRILPEPMHHLDRPLLAAFAALSLAAAGCATEEIPPYGDPARVVGGAGSVSASSGGSCTVNEMCPTSFVNDVFPILENTAKCSAAGDCHGSGQGMVSLTPANATKLREEIMNLTIQGTEPYVVPCEPMASKILCNMRVDADAGVTNPYGKCPVLMPKVAADSVDDAYLTEVQIETIAKWITCGAPDN